jgi:hypothetical protein
VISTIAVTMCAPDGPRPPLGGRLLVCVPGGYSTGLSATAVSCRWAEGQQLLRADLEGLSDVGLDALRWTNWGEQWPAWRILWTMIDHDAHHGAEIGCLRDLHRVTAGAGVPPNAANVP